MSDQRYRLDPAAPDSVDAYFVAQSDPSGPVALEQTADGAQLAPGLGSGLGGLIAAQRAPTAGSYSFSVYAPYFCLEHGLTHQASGTFRFVIRRSGPIFSMSRVSVPASGDWFRAGVITPPETVWVENLGLGAMRVDVSARGPYARLDRTSVTVTGPTGRDVAGGGARNGAQPVLLSFDLTNASPGQVTDTLNFGPPAGTLPMSPRQLGVTHGVYDRRIDMVAQTGQAGLAVGPRGELYAGRIGAIFRVDTLTPEPTTLA